MTLNSDEEMKKDEIEAQEEKREQKEVPVVSNPLLTRCSPPPQLNRSPKTPSPQAESPANTSDQTHESDGFMDMEDEPTNPPSPLVHSNGSFRAQPLIVTNDLGPEAQDVSVGHRIVQEEGSVSGFSELGTPNGRNLSPPLSTCKQTNRDSLVKRLLLGFRICGFVFCLISFSVMSADKNRGWALDSFYRYKEFRYSLAVNVMGFAYSGLQVFNIVYFFTTRTHTVQHWLRHYFDFFMDQILSYLLMSASSSAATRVEDWESNWGKDKFPDLAKVSVVMTFAAFVALAVCSMISGYILCGPKSF